MSRTARIVFGIVLTVVLMSGTALAASMKIGVIDTQKILQKSKAARDVRGAFLMDVEAKRSVLKAKETEVRKMEGELKAFAGNRGSKDFKDKQDRMAQEVKDLKRLRTDLEEELKKKDREMSRKLLLQIREVVEKFRAEKKYTLILEKKMVVSFDGTIDITDNIIDAFDKKQE